MPKTMLAFVNYAAFNKNTDTMLLVFTFYLVKIPQTNKQMANAILLRARIFTSANLKFIYQPFGPTHLFLPLVLFQNVFLLQACSPKQVNSGGHSL